MVKKSKKQKSIKRPKREKVEVHHYQKPRRLVTLEKFLPSSFDTKSTQGNVEASCFNVDKEQSMKVPPAVKEGTTSESSPKVSPGEEEKETRGKRHHLLRGFEGGGLCGAQCPWSRSVCRD